MKKILSVLLALCMLLTVLPLGMVGAAVHVAGNTTEFAGGSGTAEDPYRVATAEHLNNVRYYLDAHYLQTADIVFTEEDFAMDGPYYNESDGWEPIGTEAAPFAGMYDGGNYSIVNLYINRVTDNVGLFGYVDNGTVCSIRLRNADISGDQYVGGICGYLICTVDNGNGTIENCYTEGTVEAYDNAGGVCGYVNGKKYIQANSQTTPSPTVCVAECFNSATVISDMRAGGITSKIYYGGGTISSCINQGSVYGRYSGGIVGDLGGNSIGLSGYSSCYLNASVKECINTGLVTGSNEWSDGRAGGIVGHAGSTSFYEGTRGGINRCYDIGNQVANNIGAICALNYRTSHINSCYSLSDDGAEALANKRTFMDWDFETVWTMAGDPDYAYPELRCFTLQGSVAVEGTIAYGNTVSARFIHSGNAPAELTFEWYVGGALVGIGDTYTIAAADVGKKLTARAVSTDCLAAGVVSGTQQTVAKAIQTAAPAVPTLQSVGDNSFVIATTAGQEYSLDAATWQSGGTFIGLEPNREYVVYARLSETEEFYAGDAVEVLRVITNRRHIRGGVSIVGTPVYGETLSANLSALNTDTVSYAWVSGDAVLGTAATYTVTADDMGRSIALRVTGIGDYTGTLTSAAVTGRQASGGVAPAPAVAAKTGDTVTLVAVEGCEYSLDKVNWQTTPVFTDLSPVCTYTFYQRYAATATHTVGAVSDGTRVITAKDTVGAAPAPTVQSATGNSVTLVAVYGCQYSKDGINWQDSPTFTGLRSCSTYTFYMRYAETDTAYAGPAGASAQGSTLPTHTYDDACDPTCNVCGAYRQTEPHVYDNACDDECNVCGMLRGVGAHAYDNACDPTCNECGATRTVGAHVYDNACDTACNVCGATRSVGAHPYVSTVTVAATCGVDGVRTYTCSACGDTYTEAIPATGRHVYDDDCDPDCNACGAVRVPFDHVYDSVCDTACNTCGAIRTVAGHEYDNACDATCNLCGAVRIADTHVYDHGCDASCNVCGAVRTVAGHVYDHGCDATCNICGATRTVGNHTYGGQVTLAATCGADGVRTYTCSACGDTYTAVILATGRHTYDNACDAVCNLCGSARVASEHVYSHDCDTACNTCGATRSVAGHDYDNACDATCNVCGAARVAAPHVYDHGCDTDCAVCGAVRTVAGHRYDNACDALCNVCGAARMVDDHVYSNVCDATCNICGAIRTVAGHAYANACDAECDLCGSVRNPAEHKYDSAYDPACNVCGAMRDVEVPADAPAFVVEDAKACYGNTFTVAIRTQRNPGVVAFRLRVQYDTDLLELVNAEEGAFAGITFGPLDAERFTFTWCDAIHPDNATNDVVVLLTFCTKEGTDPTETVISVSYDQADVYNAAWEGVYFSTVSGMVKLTNVIPGDANGDGNVNVRDLGLLQQYLNGWDVNIVLEACDVNADGNVNVRDLGLFQQYLNGWSVELK